MALKSWCSILRVDAEPAVKLALKTPPPARCPEFPRMSITSAPASPAIGVVIAGVDLARELDAQTKEDLRDAFYQHCMVVVRGQKLSQDQLIAATTWLGTISKRNRPDARRREDNPYISKV